MLRCIQLLTALLVALMPMLSARAGGGISQTLKIGATAPDFSLPGVDGKTYTLKDFSSSLRAVPS